MDKSDLILQDRLTTIYEDFIQHLDDKVAAIRELWRNARSGGCDSTEIRQLQDLVLQLEIQSVPFNLFLIADKAHKLGNFLTLISHGKKHLPDVHRQQTDLLIKSLESTVSSSTDNPKQRPRTRRWEPTTITPEIDNKTPRIFILDTTRLWAVQLTEQLQLRYRPQVFSNYHSLVQAASNNFPELIITDTPLLDNKSLQSHQTGTHSQSFTSNVPIIFVARNNNLETRLLAVRSGATDFYTLPLVVDKIVNKVEELMTGVSKDPFRIMIIDNDEPMARFYAMVLGREGMNVTIIDKPRRTLELLADSRPELILINLSMPLFTGLELTRIIRQEENFAGIAIIFLSTESNYTTHLSAITSGGDDVITIPVEPDYLVATISSRVSRARTLNSINHNLFTALRELENQQFALNQHAIVSITNINGTIIYVNNKLCEISGYTNDELIGKDHSILNSAFHNMEFFQAMWSTIRQGKVWQGEVCNRKKNGDVYWVKMTIVPFIDEQSRPYQYVSINSDITAKKFIERDLLEARDLAINASQAKSDFLSKISHELRTPLNAVLGFSQLLESSKEQTLTDVQSQYISEIHNAGNHLLHLINEVLDLSRIEANQLHTESIYIPLTPFLDECIALILPITKQKHIEIFTPYRNNDDIFVMADPLRLKQVMVNLLSNAVKYNKLSGTISINVCENNTDMIVIEVTDSGSGISDEHLESIFQPFTRLPQHRKEEGVGIGLALAKRLTELMGGRIGVRSSVGKGSTFWIEIPSTELETNAILKTPDVEALPKIPVPARKAPTTVLYIEDNDTNLLLVKQLLAERTNIQLLHAYTVKSGLESALAHHPDIILMDLDLPDMSGFEGIKLLKNHSTLEATPVIAVSAYADQENIGRASQLGFVEYITKPMDINNFLAKIDKYSK